MRAGGGKQKGAQFERDVCVMLSRWLTNGEQEDVFWRSAMSGGRSTVAFKRGKRLATQVGDISCIHPAGQYFIESFAPECKFYASLDYQGLFTNKGKLLSFWDEINIQAKRYTKSAFLVAKQNRMPVIVCTDRSGMWDLGLVADDTILIIMRHDLYIFDAINFFKKCKPYVDPNRRPASNRSRKRSLPIRDI